jgi:hypothetical protein
MAETTMVFKCSRPFQGAIGFEKMRQSSEITERLVLFHSERSPSARGSENNRNTGNS